MSEENHNITGRSPDQDAPFDLILWYIEKTYFFGIVPICDVEITCIFRPVFTFVRCIEDMSHYYNIIFNTHLFSNVAIMTLDYVLCPILVQNLEKFIF